MRVVFKYLKSFIPIFILTLILLFFQAVCDLSLPNLMSDIVNTGIQQSGVSDKTPVVISKNGFDLLSLFMSDEDRATFSDVYTLSSPGSELSDKYLKKYPELKNSDVYILNTEKDDILSKTSVIYGKSVLSFTNYIKPMMEQAGTYDSMADSKEGFSDVDMSKLYSVIPMLKALPEGSFDVVINNSARSDSMLYEQMGAVFTKLFYTELGADINKMQQSYIWSIGLKMLAVALLGAFAAVLIGFFAAKISGSVAKKMRHDIFSKVNAFSNAEFDKFSTASLITRTTNDVQQIQMLIVMGIRIMCYAPIMGIGGIIMAINKSISLSWIIAVAVAVLLGLIMVIFAVALPKFKILQKLVDKLNLVSRENLSGIMVIRAFGNENHEEKRFDSANRDLFKTTRFTQRTMAFIMPAMMLIMNCVALAILWVGGHAIADSTLQIGDMMAFLQYTMQIIISFLMIAMMFIMIPRAAVSAVRIKEVLDTNPTINDIPEKEQKNIINPKGKIEFKNVSFRYNNAEDCVLKNISFTALPGQTTAFIGSTGSGKSTLINLIPRFYDVTEGAIEIDGVNVKDLSQKKLRDMIGYVPQKGSLFSGTIKSNILYGKENADDSDIAVAVGIAQASDFVGTLEEGIDSPIAQGGDNVSGGQKQRLSIARALLKKAPINIFDDSFSALDFKTDAALRKALSDYTADSTVLIVAQRVSTIMNAEQIIVLDSGRIVGIGTHKELLNSCETYREIAESQLSKEELA